MASKPVPKKTSAEHADMGMGIAFTLISIVLLVIFAFTDASSLVGAIVLAVAAFTGGFGIYGVLKFLADRSGRRSFSDWGTVAVLGSIGACLVVLWQATSASGVWSLLIILLVSLIAFFCVVGIGIGAGHYFEERRPRALPQTKRKTQRRGQQPRQTVDPAMSSYERWSLWLIGGTAILSSTTSIVIAVVQGR